MIFGIGSGLNFTRCLNTVYSYLYGGKSFSQDLAFFEWSGVHCFFAYLPHMHYNICPKTLGVNSGKNDSLFCEAMNSIVDYTCTMKKTPCKVYVYGQYEEYYFTFRHLINELFKVFIEEYGLKTKKDPIPLVLPTKSSKVFSSIFHYKIVFNFE